LGEHVSVRIIGEVLGDVVNGSACNSVVQVVGIGGFCDFAVFCNRQLCTVAVLIELVFLHCSVMESGGFEPV
jgi:hypothetical protein